ncbi:MAG TPA: mandelate racemase/muconate lactonizing enzyme family protein [Kofleriaceae bacterium]|nr:mandelate racemase/muconate lactonizing enzyme family protein [Kofleriaceae bacterium]
MAGADLAIARAEVARIGDRTVVVRLTDRAGRTGCGEGSPLPGRSPDGAADCARALERTLAGVASTSSTSSLSVLAPTAAAASAAIQAIDGALPAARFALETALLDLAAQARGTSVAELLAEPKGGPPLDELACSAVVPPTGAGAPAGVATWKVKLGDPDRLEQDLADLRRALAAGPARVRVRLDINRRWSRAEAGRYLPRLAELAPDVALEWVEEPTSAADLVALAAPQPFAIALDESVADAPTDTEEALRRGVARVLVLKPAVLGGLSAAATWAGRARAAGAVPVVSHLFDGPVALAACAELALALARPGDPAAGLGHHAGLAALPPVRVPQLGAAALRSHRPGLGVAL